MDEIYVSDLKCNRLQLRTFAIDIGILQVLEILFSIRLFKNSNPGNVKVELSIVYGNWTINITKLKFSIEEIIENSIDRIFRLYNILMVRSVDMVFNKDIKSVAGIFGNFFD